MGLWDKKNKTEYVVGLDITDTFTQVSVGNTDSEEVETMLTSPAGGTYLIPTALFKRAEVNQWFAGNEAVRYKDSEGYFVENLVSIAKNGEYYKVGEENLRPSSLLGLFIKRALSLVNMVTPINDVSCIMITVEEIDKNLIAALTEAIKSLGLKTKSVYFQNHKESFFNYILSQPKELWNRDVFLFDSTGECMKSMRMVCNKNTTPIVTLIDSDQEEKLTRNTYDEMNSSSDFAEFVRRTIDGKMYSSAYLVGNEFREEWVKDGITLLCNKGRVFQGNNLYSKGAVYSAKNRISPSDNYKSHVFLGNDKLRANVGINAFTRGEKSYIPLLDGGLNWYDAKNECEIILANGNTLSLLITPLTGKNPETVDITMGDLPKRPAKTTRLHVAVSMVSEDKMEVNIKDLGFGEIFEPVNIEWNEVISL